VEEVVARFVQYVMQQFNSKQNSKSVISNQ
jgi:hypothetical protein